MKMSLLRKFSFFGVSQGFLSTNGTYPAFRGETDSTLANDPKWMQGDGLCPSYRLFDLQGRLIKQGNLWNEETKVQFENRGMFLLILESEGRRQLIRVLNQ